MLFCEPQPHELRVLSERLVQLLHQLRVLSDGRFVAFTSSVRLHFVLLLGLCARSNVLGLQALECLRVLSRRSLQCLSVLRLSPLQRRHRLSVL
jgi:hypothetical protein